MIVHDSIVFGALYSTLNDFRHAGVIFFVMYAGAANRTAARRVVFLI